MSKIDTRFFDIGRLDHMAQLHTPIHRLDPRAKVLATAAFLLAVVSFPKYEIAALLPFFLYPIVLVTVGQLPMGFFVRKVILVAPFAVMVGIFNPFFDRDILVRIGPFAISGGWISFASIMLRFFLTIGTAFLLIATTSFQGLCLALLRLGVPRVLTVQLLFLYRYIFVLGGEAMRLVRARSLRSFGKRGLGMKVFASVVGHLLLRTLDRAQRVHRAMLSRGFDGEVRVLRPVQPGVRDVVFTLASWLIFAAMRFYNLPQMLGTMVTRVLS
jgi:cobalt/nickel transport system permease protein